MFIIELEEGVWISCWGRTLVKNNARQYLTKKDARIALAYARRYRPFVMAVISTTVDSKDKSNER